MAAVIERIILTKEGLLRWVTNYTDENGVFEIAYIEADLSSPIGQVSFIQTGVIEEETDGVSDRSEE